MCGIYCSNLAPLQESHLLSLRGPDHLSRIKIDDFFMSHSLLSITGEVTPQPLIKNNIVCLFTSVNNLYTCIYAELVLRL